MEITKENLEELRKDPFVRRFTSLFGVDLDELINEELKKPEYTEEKNINKREEPARTFAKRFDNTDKDVISTLKKKYIPPKAEEHSFLMTKQQFKEFIDNYRELLTAKRKLEYLFGINFDESGSGFSFPNSVSEIIWNFVRIIFGDENADDIADFLYGNSNFDSAEDLYEELV